MVSPLRGCQRGLCRGRSEHRAPPGGCFSHTDVCEKLRSHHHPLDPPPTQDPSHHQDPGTPPRWLYIFRFGNPNLNLHLPETFIGVPIVSGAFGGNSMWPETFSSWLQGRVTRKAEQTPAVARTVKFVWMRQDETYATENYHVNGKSTIWRYISYWTWGFSS